MKIQGLITAALFAASLPAFAEQAAPAATTGETPAAAQDSKAAAGDTATSTATQGHVARAAFASAVENREPIDNLKEVAGTDKVYYFTELRDMSGQTVTHRWEHNGKVMAEIPFNVSGDRWRVFSSKNILPEWDGEWKASVVDSKGEILSVNTFKFSAAPTQNTGSESGSDAAAGTPAAQ